jgi:hypothetical protein
MWKDADGFAERFKNQYKIFNSNLFESTILSRWDWMNRSKLLNLPNNTKMLIINDDVGIVSLLLALYLPRAVFWYCGVSPRARSVIEDGITNSYNEVFKLSRDRFFFLQQHDPLPKDIDVVVDAFNLVAEFNNVEDNV